MKVFAKLLKVGADADSIARAVVEYLVYQTKQKRYPEAPCAAYSLNTTVIASRLTVCDIATFMICPAEMLALAELDILLLPQGYPNLGGFCSNTPILITSTSTKLFLFRKPR